MSAQLSGRAAMAALLAMCTIPGETPSARKRSMAPCRRSNCSAVWWPIGVSVSTSEDARCVNVPPSSRCLHFANWLAKQSMSVRRESQAVHARVNLQMNSHVAFPRFCRGGIEDRQMLATVNRGRQVVLDQIFFFARPETAQHQDRLAHARFAQFHAFSGGSNAEPIRPKLFQCLGYFRARRAHIRCLSRPKEPCGEFCAFPQTGSHNRGSLQNFAAAHSAILPPTRDGQRIRQDFF